ncbi:unnamed protein product [Albugo candida]|uniref:Uncharacterized protein n=1 Tax=Albugo candida TaxID=65357 RepID=A0A024FYA9_9STRA|nr:unnamed protein product [Albugo candida]|eukprot:CCI39486.1 unnamed protein product [Albugo candida]
MQRLREWSQDVKYEHKFSEIRLKVDKRVHSVSSSFNENSIEDEKVSLPVFNACSLDTNRVAMNVGGPIWAMDWHPATAKQPKWNVTYLSIAAHPPCSIRNDQIISEEAPDHHYGEQRGGPGLIQIWAVSTDLSLPYLMYAIAHNGGAVWGLKWCPQECKGMGGIGMLAACFGDGTVQVFHVPRHEFSQSQERPCVERLEPVICGKLQKVVQMCLNWSPHSANQLLTGGSDGSIALWDLANAYEVLHEDDKTSIPIDVKPQRHFQDSDTITKLDTSDWGSGWVALRDVAWSPYDPYIFATTGNDSCIKIWDIRETRIPFRTHRLRSTWGLSLHWFDERSVYVAGDQGPIHCYDIFAGSFKTQYSHPQADSPIWDMKLVQHSTVPLIFSCCAAGVVRVGPTKMRIRGPSQAVDLCRLSVISEVDEEFTGSKVKHLHVDMRETLGNGQDEKGSKAKREFCPREVALHRISCSSCDHDVFDGAPCFLAFGGHSGLLLLYNMQDDMPEMLEQLLPKSKKRGRSTMRKGRGRGSASTKKRATMKRAAGISATSKRSGRKTVQREAQEDDLDTTKEPCSQIAQSELIEELGSFTVEKETMSVSVSDGGSDGEVTTTKSRIGKDRQNDQHKVSLTVKLKHLEAPTMKTGKRRGRPGSKLTSTAKGSLDGWLLKGVKKISEAPDTTTNSSDKLPSQVTTAVTRSSARLKSIRSTTDVKE